MEAEPDQRVPFLSSSLGSPALSLSPPAAPSPSLERCTRLYAWAVRACACLKERVRRVVVPKSSLTSTFPS